MIAVDRESGGFVRDGAPFVPVGANYWPGSSGVEMLAEWSEAEIQHDLDLLAGLGLNTLRFFLRWDHVEAEPGNLQAGRLERFARIAAWCAERGILAHPCLFIGFMSCDTFWPRWKAGRNLFTDPVMCERAVALCRAVGEVLGPWREHLLAVDLGNEPTVLADSVVAGPNSVAAWSLACAGALRAVLPGVPVMAGCDNNLVIADRGWHLHRQAHLDCLSVHGYPVPAWHPVAFDGMTDPMAADLLPFYVAAARAHGPVFVQEFGTILTSDPSPQRAYLSAMLPAARAAGANGFLWWCLRDITSRVSPYSKAGYESQLGLLDAEGRLRPGLEPFVDFAAEVRSKPVLEPAAATVGLLWPRHYYPSAQEGPRNDPPSLSARMLAAWHLLGRAGNAVRVVRDLADAPGVLWNAGARLDLLEVEMLSGWVAKGGRLVWQGIDSQTAFRPLLDLLGVLAVDYRLPNTVSCDLFGASHRLAAWPDGACLELAPAGAEVLARDARGLPVVGRRRFGAGCVVWCALHADQDAAESGSPAARAPWESWYRGMLELSHA